MLAVVTKTDYGYEARFERHLRHSVEKVWSSLTENEKLKKWFPELRVDDLREGGVIMFDMQDGSFEEMRILELKPHSVLEYTWGEDRVRFELEPEPTGCCLVMIEKIVKLTGHTPKDLAGWHVCLAVMESLLNEEPVGPRKTAWESRYREYVSVIGPLLQ